MRIGLDGMLLGAKHSGVEHAIEGLVRALLQVAPEHDYTLIVTDSYAAQVVAEGPRFSRPQAVGPAKARPLRVPDALGPAEARPLRMRAVPPFVRGRLLRILYEQTQLARDLSGCDVLHAPGYVMPLNWRGPSVLTVYDVIALSHPTLCKPSNVWHYRRMLPRSLRRAHAIVVPSEAVARAVREVEPAAGPKLRVIPLGLDPMFRPADAADVERVRAQYALPEPYLLCVGNIEPKKNLPAVLAAFDEAADALPHDLVLVGRRAWKCGEFDAALATMRHRSRVHLVGYAAPGDLPALYTGAALLLQWSLVEGMGLPPLEAMACGTPALVSDDAALVEMSGPAAEVVPLGSPVLLAERLTALLPDERRLAALREAGLRHAAQFTWQRHAREVVALYEEVLHAQS